MPRFVHAADLHIDSPLRGLDAYAGAPVEALRAATRRALENLVNLVIEQKAEFLLLAGDTYDTNPSTETALYFRGQMQRLADAQVPVLIVLGNHDHAGVAPRNVRLPENVHVFSSERAETVEVVSGVFVHGQSYPTQSYMQDLVQGYPAPVRGALNIGMLHTCLEESDHAPYAPTSQARLGAFGYGYWALGHVHRHLDWEVSGCRIVFPGNLQGRNARETGAKGAVVVEYEGARIQGFRHEALDVVRWHHVEITPSGEEDPLPIISKAIFEATDADRASGRLCAVRVTVSGVGLGGWLALTDEGLHDFLRGETQASAKELWLEKVRVNVRPAAGQASEIASRLSALAAELLEDEATRRELYAQVASLKGDLRAAEHALDKDVTELREENVALVLERAVQRLRTTLEGRAG